MKFSSQVYSATSGSVGGLTYSRNRGGMYTRTRAIPTNPNSTRQQNARGNFAAMLTAWTALTQAQRDAWILYADNTPATDSLGATIVLTGQNMFVRCNTLRLLASETVINTAPSVFNRGPAVADVTGDAITIDVTDLAMPVFYNAATTVAGDTLLFIGRTQNIGRRFYKGPYQFAAKLPFAIAATGGTFSNVINTLTTDYPIVDSTNVPFRLINVTDDGRVSASFNMLGPVIAI